MVSNKITIKDLCHHKINFNNPKTICFLSKMMLTIYKRCSTILHYSLISNKISLNKIRIKIMMMIYLENFKMLNRNLILNSFKLMMKMNLQTFKLFKHNNHRRNNKLKTKTLKKKILRIFKMQM